MFNTKRKEKQIPRKIVKGSLRTAGCRLGNQPVKPGLEGWRTARPVLRERKTDTLHDSHLFQEFYSFIKQFGAPVCD